MKFKFTLTFLLIAKMVLSQGWYLQVINISGIPLRYVHFADPSTGYACGSNGTILKTTNAGLNWAVQTSGTGQSLWGIYFINQLTGWATGDNGTILNTTNGGVNWTAQTSGISNNLESVFFPSSSTGYCGGRFNICKTTNGGSSWSHQTINDDMTAISFINTNIGWGCCWGGKIYNTTNGGDNWVQQPSGIQLHLHGIYFINASSGWAVVDDPGAGGIIATTNGGSNWSLQLWNIPGQHSVYFVNQSTGYTAGGNIYKTTNGGTNWVLQLPPSGVGECQSVFFANSNTGWCVTDFGKIIATTTGGIDAITKISSDVPQNFTLSQNYPNPFNPSTKIDFDIPKASVVKITIFDVLGKEIEILVNEELKPGIYEVSWDASGISSGVYFYKLSTENFSQTKKLILSK